MLDFVIENNILKGASKPMNDDRKLSQVIFQALSENPDHVAQIDGETGEQTTCRKIKERSIRCALWMRKLAILPGDIVVVVTHNHLDSCVAFFATTFVDAIFNAWNQNITLHTAQRFMKQFSPTLIFTCEKAVDVLREAATLENLTIYFVVFGEHPRAQSFNTILDSQTQEEIDNFVVVNERDQQELAVIMLSSGTVGFPKGVMLSGRSLTSLTAGLTKSNPSDVCMWYAPLDWASGIFLILGTLVRGNIRVIPSQEDLDSFFRYVEKYKIVFVSLPPLLAVSLAKDKVTRNHNLKSLKFIIIGGCKHGKPVLEGIKKNVSNARVSQGYGCTEMGVITSRTPTSRNPESVGFVLANSQIKFVDVENGEALGPNTSGELYVKSPNAMLGYYKDPEATKEAFDEEGWYRTGDIGYYNQTGEIFVTDRVKEIMKYQNHQISPAEIEELLMSHSDVDEVAVVGMPREGDGDWPVAFVKLRPGSQVTKDELIQLTSVLEDYKKLRGGLYFLEQLPRTGSGKIARYELRELVKQLN